MPDHQIIAIGGTGQVVLHLYATWYLTGVVQESFRALVVDTDRLIPSLQFLCEFFRDVQAASGTDRASVLPRIDYLHVGREESVTVEELLAGRSLGNAGEFEHSVQAFFSKSDRRQSVREGLFARPALSAVLSPDSLWETLRYIPRSTIGLVCSVIGGTGAGLALPIVSYLQKRPQPRHSLRAVFLGRYFQPNPDTRPDQLEVFQSNEALFEESRRNLVSELDHYALIKPSKMVERHEGEEKKMRHWPWPEEDHPFWCAASALKQILQDTITDIGTGRYYPYVKEDRARAVDKLEQAIARARTATQEEPFTQAARDVFVKLVWGPLCEYVQSYADFLGVDRAEFSLRLQRVLEQLWLPRTDSQYALGLVFPEPRIQRNTSPLELIRCGWEPRPDSVTRETLGGLEDAVRRVAARALFILLRAGGAAR